MSLKSISLLIGLAAFSTVTHAAVEPLIVAQPQPLQPVCWFQGQEYSEGARIEMAGRQVVCGSRDPLVSGGPLIWLALDEQGNPVYPEPPRPNKITIKKN